MVLVLVISSTMYSSSHEQFKNPISFLLYLLLVQIPLAVSVGLFIAMPIEVYQIVSYVTPALYPHERRQLVLGLLLALAGAGLVFITVISVPYYLAEQWAQIPSASLGGVDVVQITKATIVFFVVFAITLTVFLLYGLGGINVLTGQNLGKLTIVALLALAAGLPPQYLTIILIAAGLGLVRLQYHLRSESSRETFLHNLYRQYMDPMRRLSEESRSFTSSIDDL